MPLDSFFSLSKERNTFFFSCLNPLWRLSFYRCCCCCFPPRMPSFLPPRSSARDEEEGEEGKEIEVEEEAKGIQQQLDL